MKSKLKNVLAVIVGVAVVKIGFKLDRNDGLKVDTSV